MDFSKTLLEQLGTVTYGEFIQDIAKNIADSLGHGTPEKVNVNDSGDACHVDDGIDLEENAYYLQASIARACNLSEHALSKLHRAGKLDIVKDKCYVFLDLKQVKDHYGIDDSKIDMSKLIPLKDFEAHKWSRNKVCRAGHMSTKQVADLIDEPVEFVTDLCRHGYLPCVRLTPNSKYEIPSDAAIEYVRKYKKNFQKPVVENLSFFEEIKQ